MMVWLYSFNAKTGTTTPVKNPPISWDDDWLSLDDIRALWIETVG